MSEKVEYYTFEYIVNQQNYPKSYGRKFVVAEQFDALQKQLDECRGELREASQYKVGWENQRKYIEDLQSQLDEQCRINGIGQERELKLMAEITALKSQNENLIEALKKISKFKLVWEKKPDGGFTIKDDTKFPVEIAEQTLRELGIKECGE